MTVNTSHGTRRERLRVAPFGAPANSQHAPTPALHGSDMRQAKARFSHPAAALAGWGGGDGLARANTNRAVASVALFEKLLHGQGLQLGEMGEDRLLDILGSLAVVTVSAAERFGD